MLRRSLFLFFFPVLVGSSYAAVDLTPMVREVVDDGVTYQEVSCKTPEGKVVFTLPPAWTIRGQKDRAQMTGPDKSFAEAVIEATPLQEPEPLDEAAIAKFKKQVLATLPAGSTKITTVNEAQNSLMPGGNPSFEIVITYDLWGKIFQRSALLVNGPQDRLTFRFTCLKADFTTFNTNFRRSLMTWRAVAAKESPKSEPPATAAAPVTASK
jgi:hypothetical protein